jgi:putative membrane protein
MASGFCFPIGFAPLMQFCLGLIPLIGSILVFGLSALLVQGFRLRYGIISAIVGAIALSIVNSILVFILRQVGVVAI